MNGWKGNVKSGDWWIGRNSFHFRFINDIYEDRFWFIDWGWVDVGAAERTTEATFTAVFLDWDLEKRQNHRPKSLPKSQLLQRNVSLHLHYLIILLSSFVFMNPFHHFQTEHFIFAAPVHPLLAGWTTTSQRKALINAFGTERVLTTEGSGINDEIVADGALDVVFC